MNKSEPKRRSVVLGLPVLGLSPLFGQGIVDAPASARRAGVVGANEGERLVHFRDHGNILIKAGSGAGGDQLALGTQQVTLGAGIPVHRHFHMEEAFYVLQGSGVVTLDDVPHPFSQGATIVIPPNTWHGFANPDHEVLLLWIVAPAGLDGFFRETCTPPGAPPKQLTREQIRLIARKYGTEFR